MESFTTNQCPNLDLDEAAFTRRLNDLLALADQIDQERLFAAGAPHSGALLPTVPVEVLGLHLPDEAVRVNITMRLGTIV